MDKGSTVLVNQASTIPPEFLEAPVTSKKITNFFDFLTRSDAAGHAYDISKRNALIKKDAKKISIIKRLFIVSSVGFLSLRTGIPWNPKT